MHFRPYLINQSLHEREEENKPAKIYRICLDKSRTRHNFFLTVSTKKNFS